MLPGRGKRLSGQSGLSPGLALKAAALVLRWARFGSAKKNLVWRVVKRMGRGDDLVEIAFSPALRHAHPDLPETFLARAIRYRRKGFRSRVLLTSLLDPMSHPATEIVELYHERWELEME